MCRYTRYPSNLNEINVAQYTFRDHTTNNRINAMLLSILLVVFLILITIYNPACQFFLTYYCRLCLYIA